jgi:hypothetical protein
MTRLFATTYTQQCIQLLQPTHGHAGQIAVTEITSFLTVQAAEIETRYLNEVLSYCTVSLELWFARRCLADAYKYD